MPWRGLPVILFCAIYLLSGTLDHDPWKTYDAIHLGISWEFANQGHWLSPRIANDPWLGGPPLYHWIAALLGNLFTGILPFHNAARLATLIFAMLLMLMTALASRDLHGVATVAWGVPLLLIGTLGLLVPIHEAEPMIALLAAQAGVFYGLSKIRRSLLTGGLVAGLAWALGFWTSGSTALLFLSPLFLLPLAHRDWRNRNAFLGLSIAGITGFLVAAIWPLLIYMHTPEGLQPLLQAELTRLKPHTVNWHILQDHLELLSWADWPIFPLALWTLWNQQRQLGTASVMLPMLASGTTLLLLIGFTDPQPLFHLILLVPLTLLAAPGVDRLRRGAANALDWFGMMTFTLLSGLIWLGAIAMNSGTPERVAKNFLKAEPGFVGSWSSGGVSLAIVITLTWLLLLMLSPRSPWRGITHWASGMTMTWGLLSMLWLPWIDYGRSYRPVAASLERALAGSTACIAQKGLGDTQKASLRYFNGIATVSSAGRGRNDCPWLLVQTTEGSASLLVGWHKVWEGNRPGDKKERLRLYRRI